MRVCAVCGSKNYTILHKQKFIVPDYVKTISYKVVLCEECGFIFASDVPEQKKLDNFYKKNLKYTYRVNKAKLPERIEKEHNDFFKFINGFIKKVNYSENIKNFSILDVGCGNGHQLFCFKKSGYSNLLGIDPAPECKIIAKERYGIKVKPYTMAEFVTNKKFNLILLQSVFEHINDIKSFTQKIIRLLKNDGLIAISVPNTEGFGEILKEPFMEFSLEHINFFTINSLKNIFGKQGLKIAASDSNMLDSLGSNSQYSLWERTNEKTSLSPDSVGAKQVKKYIAKSQNKLDKIKKIIDRFAVTQEEVVIWGVGSLTARLIADTNLAKLNIKAFIDSNSSMQGKTIMGTKIHPPIFIKDKKITVFISTFVFENEIKRILLKKYRHKGKILSLL